MNPSCSLGLSSRGGPEAKGVGSSPTKEQNEKDLASYGGFNKPRSTPTSTEPPEKQIRTAIGQQEADLKDGDDINGRPAYIKTCGPTTEERLATMETHIRLVDEFLGCSQAMRDRDSDDSSEDGNPIDY